MRTRQRLQMPMPPHELPIGNSCGGIGICNRCRVRIVEGSDNLTPPTRFERDSDQRLACQAVVLGDCTVTTSYW